MDKIKDYFEKFGTAQTGKMVFQGLGLKVMVFFFFLIGAITAYAILAEFNKSRQLFLSRAGASQTH